MMIQYKEVLQENYIKIWALPLFLCDLEIFELCLLKLFSQNYLSWTSVVTRDSEAHVICAKITSTL